MQRVVTRFWFPSSIAFGCLVMVGSVEAQIVPDGTLPVNSIVRQQENTSVIEGGTQAGSNLFHSFSEFNVGENQGAYFTNSPGIQNIFSRVTGRNASQILGTLGVVGGNANLFFLNPNGIIFGANARLDVRGSFLATTANAIGFADGAKFSATNPQATPLLTVSVPIGLQYGTNSGSIINRSVAASRDGNAVGLQVQPGKSLALLGGNVSLEGGRILAPGGRVELGGVAGEGTVGLQVNGNDLRLSFPVDVPLSDVSITNNAIVNVRASGGGSIAINARLLNISGVDTRLRAGIAEGRGSASAQAGDIDINTAEVTNIDRSGIINRVEERRVGRLGNVNITTGSLAVTNGGQIQAVTRGRGNAGNVNITARDRVSLDGFANRLSSKVSSEVDETGKGEGGDININTRELVVTNGGFLSASTKGEGNAGNVNITARERVSFDGVGTEDSISGATCSVQETGRGNGGNINITKA